ncbi:hypothetical protein GCM10007862_24210 [Dyella lipolytica]|nr:hypothetical protein GCM10007862_24210 [Dyella lipolytica]
MELTSRPEPNPNELSSPVPLMLLRPVDELEAPVAVEPVVLSVDVLDPTLEMLLMKGLAKSIVETSRSTKPPAKPTHEVSALPAACVGFLAAKRRRQIA